MNLSAVINQLISLFLMMLAGYLIARVGIMTPEFRKRLSSFTLNTAAPGIPAIPAAAESASSWLRPPRPCPVSLTTVSPPASRARDLPLPAWVRTAEARKLPASLAWQHSWSVSSSGS